MNTIRCLTSFIVLIIYHINPTNGAERGDVAPIGLTETVPRDPLWIMANERRNPVSESGGIRVFDLPFGTKVKRVTLNGKVQPMKCTLDPRGSNQLFCAFAVNAVKAVKGSTMQIIMSVQKEERLVISADLKSFTVHLLFDHVQQQLAVYVLPEIEDFTERNKPMGLANSDANVGYLNALIQALVASLKDEIPRMPRLEGTDAHSMMLVEVLRTYLNQNFAQIINPNTFKAYVIMLCDFLGNQRGKLYGMLGFFYFFSITFKLQ